LPGREIDKLGEGASHEELLDAYPNLTENDIHAALLYAAEYLGNETFIYLKTGTYDWG
jgi:uncharacterized protein (DUF433 family)